MSLLVARQPCEAVDLKALPCDADKGIWTGSSLFCESLVGMLRAPVDNGEGNGLEKLRLLEVRRRLVESISMAGQS